MRESESPLEVQRPGPFTSFTSDGFAVYAEVVFSYEDHDPGYHGLSHCSCVSCNPKHRSVPPVVCTHDIATYHEHEEYCLLKASHSAQIDRRETRHGEGRVGEKKTVNISCKHELVYQPYR